MTMTSTSCPACGGGLTSAPNLFGPGLGGHQCERCKASFVAWDVTQKLFEAAGLSLDQVHAAVKTSVPGKPSAAVRACPSCGKPLRRCLIKGVELELCEECGTTAFDPGEVFRVTGGKYGAAPVGPKQGIFEMLWDCEFCDTKALLGKTNRYCPVCGSPQDPKRRRFPEPGQETAVNTDFDGADNTCPACSTPNGAKAVHCKHCGSPMDGSKKVQRLADQVDGASVAPPKVAAPAPQKRRALWPWVVGAGLVLTCGVCSVGALWTKSAKATVSGHTWQRSIDVEVYASARDDAWCDSLPSGAYDVSRSKKQRSTKDVPDGETCSTRNVDRGDGTFERKQECKPKYRKEPVSDDSCSFKVDRWSKARSLDARGTLEQTPTWPQVTSLRRGTSLGSEREGARHETYTVALKGPKGESWNCDVGETSWRALEVGEAREVQVRVMTGGVDCSSLNAK